MADVKISALPASSTPLAGTEILPIVQSSTTRQVSVANLTAGRAVNALSITASSLTSGRVTYAGASGLLSDSANLTFSGSALSVIGNITSSTLQLGTNPAGVSIGVLGIPNQKRIYGRNAANSADVSILYVDGSNGLALGPSDSVTVTSAGNVGIGTNSPSALLEVSGAFGSSAYSEAARFTNTSVNSGTKLTFYGVQGVQTPALLSGSIGFNQTFNQNNNGQPAFIIETGNSGSISEKLRVTYTGVLDIGTGAGAVGQIQFPATQVPSANANTLDDYEEGTWTPGFGTGWTTSPSVATTATYVKIGKQVTVSVYLLDGVSTAGALITGLPFSVSVESSMTGFSGSTSTAPLMTGVTQSGTSQIRSIPAATMTSLYWTVSNTYFTN